jgi:hypothetical protein
MSMSPNDARRGGYQILRQQPSFPWSRWEVAKRLADGQSGLLLAIETKSLGNRSRSQLVAHLRVSNRHLQPLEAETVGERTLLFSALPAGQSVAEQWNPDRSLPPAQVCKLGIALSQALSVLHDHSVIHGAVRADRVWVTKSGLVILLRDPGINLANQGRPGAGEYLDFRDEAGLYAAPEFAQPNQASDPATDIYSLGCLLFRLVSGRPPVDAISWNQALAEHAQTSPPELVSAVAEKESGDPLYRVIAHAMAKDRGARFQSAEQLSAALRAILPLTSDVAPAAPVAGGTAAPVATSDGTPIKPVDGLVATDPTTAATSRREKSHKSNGKRQTMIVAGLVSGVVLVLAGIAVSLSGSKVADRQPASPTVQPTDPEGQPKMVEVEPESDVANQPSQADSYRVIEDDRLLYVPPYRPDAGSVSLELLPPGPAAIVSIRPAFLRDGRNGVTLADTFQGELSGLLNALSSRSGLSIESIRRCTIAMHPGLEAEIETSIVIEVKEPIAVETLLDDLQVSESRTADGLTIYAGDDIDGDACYIPPAALANKTVSKFAIGSVARISEVADLEGGEILLPRSLRSLWDHASADADIVAMSPPNFLFADGRTLLQSSVPQMIGPLKSFLIPDVSVGLLVARFDADRVYAETRLTPSGGINEALLLKQLQDSVRQWPNWADQFVIESQPDPSWRLLAARLPLMMRFFVNHSRFGTSDGSAVANVYLPRRIVPQLSVAISLALNTPRGGPLPDVQPAPHTMLTLEQILERPMSVSFDQESLEFAIDTVVGEFRQSLPPGTEMPPVRIVGGDLQKMGITQNQQIRGFDKRNVSLRSVLTDLVLNANPDRTATGPDDPKQALIWVVADDPQQPGSKVILVTTRQAAEGKYELPREFQLPR